MTLTRTKKNKQKKTTITSAKKLAWDAFSKYIRTRDCLKTLGRKDCGLCYTCGREKEISGLQAGHYIPGRHNAYLFDEIQVHAQCYYCNGPLKGNWPEYYNALCRDFGREKADELKDKRWEVKQYKVFELQEIQRMYEEKLKELQ